MAKRLWNARKKEINSIVIAHFHVARKVFVVIASITIEGWENFRLAISRKIMNEPETEVSNPLSGFLRKKERGFRL
ncbi:MAG: hypothetical protein JXA77_04870 [Bacteroidales bacterium]|nr:hypothetical protein [Bacteroidales bacterium]MBN2820032.1 hypothetical protein [Bacteroidales bacterium]